MRIFIGAIACFLWLMLVDYVCRDVVPALVWFAVAIGGMLFLIHEVSL